MYYKYNNHKIDFAEIAAKNNDEVNFYNLELCKHVAIKRDVYLMSHTRKYIVNLTIFYIRGNFITFFKLKDITYGSPFF